MHPPPTSPKKILWANVQNSVFAVVFASLLTSKNIETQPVRKMFDFYGRRLGCFEEVPYEELRDYVEHRNTLVLVLNVSQSSGETQANSNFRRSSICFGGIGDVPKAFCARSKAATDRCNTSGYIVQCRALLQRHENTEVASAFHHGGRSTEWTRTDTHS
jgi:hypothetical protein